MEILGRIFVAILVAMSIFSVVLCLIRGKGASHKMLVIFTSMLVVMAIVCFGGHFVLSYFDMGWRCTPFNTMLFLCSILFIVMLGFGMKELSILEDDNPAIVWCGCISMLLVIIITLFSTFFYFQLSSWHDGLTTYNNQTIVYANDQHGGSCAWQYYTHINDLVHGVEILQEDGWIGNPPHFFNP